MLFARAIIAWSKCTARRALQAGALLAHPTPNQNASGGPISRHGRAKILAQRSVITQAIKLLIRYYAPRKLGACANQLKQTDTYALTLRITEEQGFISKRKWSKRKTRIYIIHFCVIFSFTTALGFKKYKSMLIVMNFHFPYCNFIDNLIFTKNCTRDTKSKGVEIECVF